MTLSDIAIDKLDAEYLLGMYIARLHAGSHGSIEDAAYYRGRIDEYVAQNAIDADELPKVRELAAQTVYGAGPATGAQC